MLLPLFVPCMLPLFMEPRLALPELFPPQDGLAQALRAGGAEWTVANPLRSTWRETFCRLFTPRGTPRPAEPDCTRTRRGGAAAMAVIPCPTITVVVPLTGGCGFVNRLGGFVTTGTVFQPPHPPGAHIQP